MVYLFEIIFGISAAMNFVIEYYPDGSTIPEKDLRKIAMRYI